MVARVPIPTVPSFAVFLAGALILLVTRDHAIIYIVARGVHQERLEGVVSALAVGCGIFVHALAAPPLLAAALVRHRLHIGQERRRRYQIYIGVRMLVARGDHTAVSPPPSRAPRRVFWHDFFVAVLNPKTALFFFAFLPLFADPSDGSVPLQSLFFGTLFAALGVCTDSTCGLLAGTLQGWLRRTTALTRRGRYVTGSLYVGVGPSAAVAEPAR